MTTTKQIQNFYDSLQFPGVYTKKQLDAYGPRPSNKYLGFMYDHLDHGLTVLDAGCGTGLVTNMLASRFQSKFTAVDFADGINLGQEYAKQHDLNNTRWIREDLLEFAPKEQFDVIICQGVLHHVPEHARLLENLKTWLRPGGSLLLGLYNPWGKLLKKFSRLSYHGSQILYLDQERNPFELSFTVRQVLDMCKDLEFRSASHWCVNAFWTNFISIFNSSNGGLILYSFRKKNV